MYKIILWINDDLKEHLEVLEGYNPKEILIIGDGIRTLSKKELMLTDEQKSKIIPSTQLVFLSHGTFQCRMEPVEEAIVSYQMNDGNSAILIEGQHILHNILSNVSHVQASNGLLMHVISCYAAITVDSTYGKDLDILVEKMPSKSTILFHGGNAPSRALNVTNALSMVRDLSLTQNIESIEERLHTLKKLMQQSCMIAALQHLGKIDELENISTNLIEMVGAKNTYPIELLRTNILHINFCMVPSKMSTLQNFVETSWNRITSVVEAKLSLSLDRSVPTIKPFEYIYQAICNGALGRPAYVDLSLHYTSDAVKEMVLNSCLECLSAEVDKILSLGKSNAISPNEMDTLMTLTLMLGINFKTDTIDAISKQDIGYIKKCCSLLFQHEFNFMSEFNSTPAIFAVHPLMLELLFELNPASLPSLFITDNDDKSLLAHILSDESSASKILAKYKPYFIDINNCESEIKLNILLQLSSYKSTIELSKILSHLLDIDLSPRELWLLCENAPQREVLDLILLKASSRSLDINYPICTLPEADEYIEIAKNDDIKKSYMDASREQVEYIKSLIGQEGGALNIEYIVDNVVRMLGIFDKIAFACAVQSDKTYHSLVKERSDYLKDALDKSPDFLDNLLDILEKTLDPLFDELKQCANVKAVIEEMIKCNTHPLIVLLAQRDNVLEILPTILKYSADIELGNKLLLALAHTPQAAKILPMILDKISAWKIDINQETADEIEHISPDVWEIMHHNPHINLQGEVAAFYSDQ